MITSMTRKFLVLAGLGALCSAAVGSLSAAPKSHPDTKGWPALIATDFSDAVTKPGDWVFENGTLVAKDHNTIWTKKSYSNFVLDLEF